MPATLTGAGFDAVPAAGTPNGTANAPLSFFPRDGSTFGIITSGDVSLADDPNTAGSSGASLGGASVRGNTDFDVTILKLSLTAPAGTNCLSLDFAFYSEEFPEYVGSSFNDAFIAELDSSTWTTAGSTITAPNNFAFDTSGNVVSINSTGATAMSAANAGGTTYDGATTLLSASAVAAPGPHTLYLSIFDQGDTAFDSAAFVDNVRFINVANPSTDCVAGATPVDPNTPPVAVDDAYAVTGGGVLTVPAPGVLANDTDAEGDPLTAELVSGPASGTLVLNPDGSFTYTPGEDTVGPVTFTYRASDGIATSNVATVTITVTAGCEGIPATLVGTSANDRLVGTSGKDVIVGLGGKDDINGRDSNDLICGGSGADELNGDGGADRLLGGSGNDDLKADAGDDTVFGGAGDDRLRGDDGNDTMYGGDGNDVLEGDADRDRLFGDAGVDRLFGGSDADALDGGAGTPDRCDGEGGTDSATASCEVRISAP